MDFPKLPFLFATEEDFGTYDCVCHKDYDNWGPTCQICNRPIFYTERGGFQHCSTDTRSIMTRCRQDGFYTTPRLLACPRSKDTFTALDSGRVITVGENFESWPKDAEV